MYFKNILVPYDRSSFSKRAFKVALNIAQKYESTITLVSCINVFITGWFVKSTWEHAALKLIRKKLKKELSDLESQVDKKVVPIKSKIIERSSIAQTLVSFAKSNKIDLIVLGSHGRTRLDGLILGSVSNGIVQRAKCPVLVIK